MPGSKSGNEQESKSPRQRKDDDSEDESEVIEESPCGRWIKRREEVNQRDVPGIDMAYLAMDTEEGVEVVWNEVQFSERKNFKANEEKIRRTFDNLTQLQHANIVKFHKYWTDTKTDKPRVIFITEYMSSGSLIQFLKRTKKNHKTLQIKAWKRWCIQILSALNYLHSCEPPIVHGNLTCDTIFIQHNGLVKIGSVAPDAIHHHVKTFRDNVSMKNIHYVAPEYGESSMVTPKIDIYSFGMCALEMAALEIGGNGENNCVTPEIIQKTIDSIEEPLQREFISKCLSKNPNDRPSTRELLFDPVLFEFPSLKLFAAHNFVNNASLLPEDMTDEAYQSKFSPDHVIADVIHTDGRSEVQFKFSQVPPLELEKFLEDVRNGLYPLSTLYSQLHIPSAKPRAVSPELPESVKSLSPEPTDVETRMVLRMTCSLKPHEEGNGFWLTILLRMDDKMNRQLSCEVTHQDSAFTLADELVHHGFINEVDREKLAALIEDKLHNTNSVNGKPLPIHDMIPVSLPGI